LGEASTIENFLVLLRLVSVEISFCKKKDFKLRNMLDVSVVGLYLKSDEYKRYILKYFLNVLLFKKSVFTV